MATAPLLQPTPDGSASNPLLGVSAATSSERLFQARLDGGDTEARRPDSFQNEVSRQARSARNEKRAERRASREDASDRSSKADSAHSHRGASPLQDGSDLSSKRHLASQVAEEAQSGQAAQSVVSGPSAAISAQTMPVSPSTGSPALSAAQSVPQSLSQPTSSPLAPGQPAAARMAAQAARQQVSVQLAADPAAVERAQAAMDQIRSGLRSGMRYVTLELVPEELGRLSIHLSMRDGRLHAAMRAESREAVALLEQNLPELKSALKEAGIEMGNFTLSHDAGGSGRSENPEHAPMGTLLLSSLGDAQEPPHAGQILAAGGSGELDEIDLYA